MNFTNEKEKEIYMKGFFAGKNSAKPKSNYTQEELEEISDTLHTYCDATINVLSADIEKAYQIPEWFDNIPGLKEYKKRKEEKANMFTDARNFICYVQSKIISEYLDHINTRK